MHWVQIRECLLDAHQICLAEPAANVHIECDQGDAMRRRRESAHQNELDLRRNQSVHQFTKVLHDVFPLLCAATRQNSTRHHWPAYVPMAFLPGCLSITTNQCHRPLTHRKLAQLPSRPSLLCRVFPALIYFALRLWVQIVLSSGSKIMAISVMA